MRLVAASIVLSFLTSTACGFGLPKELVGMWSVPDAEFDGDNLRGGDALYLLEDGKAGLVGAPLPVVKCPDGSVCAPIVGISGKATYDAKSKRLTLNLESAGKRVAIAGEYNSREKKITLRMPAKDSQFVRRKKDVPEGVKKVLNTPQ